MGEKVELELLRRLEAITVERKKEREELDRLRRLVPTGTYTLNVAHEEEIQRLKDAGEVLIRSLERMTKERDEAERWRNAHHEASIRLQAHDCGEEAAKLYERAGRAEEAVQKLGAQLEQAERELDKAHERAALAEQRALDAECERDACRGMEKAAEMRAERLFRDRALVDERARKAAQLLIAEIRADGPMNVDEAAEAAVKEINRLRTCCGTEKAAEMRAERGETCSGCERPTMVGDDFGGPCVHDSDFECALAKLKDARAESQRLSDEWSAALKWVRSGGPCQETAGCIYGPYLDACEIVAESLERRDHLRVDTLREQLRLEREGVNHE